MTQSDRLLEACRDAVGRATRKGADQAEVFAVSSMESKVNLEADDVSLAVSNDEERYGVRLWTGGCTGFASTNDPASEALDEAIDAALALARVTPPDPHGALPEPRPGRAVAGLCDPALEQLGVAEVGKLCGELVARTRDLDPRVRLDSGWVATSTTTCAIASSTGIEAAERTTDAEGLLFGMAVDGDQVGSFDLDQVEECSLAAFTEQIDGTPERFVRRVLQGLDAGAGETFKGSLVLTPDAVAEFVLPALVGALSAQAVRTGKSRFADRLGERVFSEIFSLTDDATLPGRPGSSSFDREGIGRAPLPLIEDGAVSAFLFNTHEARALGREGGSTGHASGGTGAPPAVGPTNLIVRAGALDREALLGEVERGILLHRYSGNTDPVSGDFSGVAKGSALLRRGSEPRPIQETLISGNLYELLAAISGVGRETRWVGGSVCAPMLRLEGVSVTAG